MDVSYSRLYIGEGIIPARFVIKSHEFVSEASENTV
jgi:hypothetical protein